MRFCYCANYVAGTLILYYFSFLGLVGGKASQDGAYIHTKLFSIGMFVPSTLADPVKRTDMLPTGCVKSSLIDWNTPNALGRADNFKMLSLFGSMYWSPKLATLPRYLSWTYTDPASDFKTTRWFVGFWTAISTVNVGRNNVPDGRTDRSKKIAFCENEYRAKKYKAAAPPTSHKIVFFNAAFF